MDGRLAVRLIVAVEGEPRPRARHSPARQQPPEFAVAHAGPLGQPWSPNLLWIADSPPMVAKLVADGIPRGSIFRWREVCELVGAEEPFDVLRRLLSRPAEEPNQGAQR